MIYNYLIEIKNRILLIIFSWICLIIVSYCYKETILFLLVKPNFNLFDSKDFTFYFITTNITDTFYVYLKLSYFFSFQLTFLFFMYHLLLFLSPGLYNKEFKFFQFFLTLLVAYWLFINYFFNKYIFPVIWFFFNNYQQVNSKIIRIFFESQFIDFIQIYCINFYIIGFFSQLFVFLLIYLNRIKTYINFIKQFRKIFYTFFLLQSTFLTPPDIFSQICTCFCLIFIFEFFIVIVVLKKTILNMNLVKVAS